MLVPCAAVFAGTVYKWVDQNGVTHYSDQPNPGAEKVTVESSKSTNAAASNPPRDVAPTQQDAGPPYSTCTISSPTNDQVFLNVSELPGTLRVEPQLYSGHRISVALDGKRVEGVGDTGTSFTISPIFRGTHTLNLVVHDATGTVVCSSPSVTFHVRQPTVNRVGR